MAENTNIAWADDSISFWWGCEKISDGCKNCYAKTIADKFAGDLWGSTKPRMMISTALKNLCKLNRKAEKEGKPRIVFINSMSDFFEDHKGPVVDRQGKQLVNATTETAGPNSKPLTLGDLRRDAFEVFDKLPWLRFLLLTKRPENIRRMWPSVIGIPDFASDTPQSDGQTFSFYRPNVWLGTSISDQPTADAMVPELLKCCDLCPVLFLSVEPLLGEINLRRFFAHSIHCHKCHPGGGLCRCPMIRWCIIGAESGSNRRECKIEDLVSIVKQCRATGVACFVKQDCAAKPGQQGRIPDDIWAIKEFPQVKP